jgi:imidazolonepropionase-like amidohydrolase
LSTLVSLGLTRFEALTTATANAGVFARQHLKRQTVPFGTITVGSRADILLLRNDPRRDLAALGEAIGIVVRGEWRPQRH